MNGATYKDNRDGWPIGQHFPGGDSPLGDNQGERLRAKEGGRR